MQTIIEIVFRGFLKKFFFSNVVYDLDGRLTLVYNCVLVSAKPRLWCQYSWTLDRSLDWAVRQWAHHERNL